MDQEREDYDDAEPRRGRTGLRELAAFGLAIATCFAVLVLLIRLALPGPFGPD